MRVFGWTILAAVCIAAVAPNERLTSVVTSDSLKALVLRDERLEEIDAAIDRLLSAEAPPSVTAYTREGVRSFYAAATGPAWVTYASTSKASEGLALLRSAAEHGLSPADYGEPELSNTHLSLEQVRGDDAQQDDTQQIARLADFDVRLTGALLAFGRDVAVGRTQPKAWKARRDLPDLVGTLRHAASAGDLNGWLDAVQPSHPQYAALRHALQELDAQRGHGGWLAVPDFPKKFAIGESHPSVVPLRQLLAAGGHLIETAVSATPEIFDERMAAGVRAFQETHGLTVTGLPDAATVASLNVPIDERVRQLALNLERWRWMPDDLGANHLLVNIPGYQLFAREDDRTVFDMRVVVGKPNLRTPIFSSEMTTVVFSPFWHIPESIKAGETIPQATKDPDSLRRRGIEILRTSGTGTTRVDPAEVDWSDPALVRQLAFRQRPGPQNALGHVKFLFPNPHDVYLHDTPSDSLFARAKRALSHGCVRVEEPEKLAKYILRHHEEWDDARIVSAMHSGNERGVKLDATVPVHIAYFTAWVADDGRVSFFPDVYGYDLLPKAR